MKIELGNPRKKTTSNDIRYLVFNAKIEIEENVFLLLSGLRLFKGVLHPSKNKKGYNYYQNVWMSTDMAGLIYDEVVYQEFSKQAKIKLHPKEIAIMPLIGEQDTIDALFNEDDEG